VKYKMEILILLAFCLLGFLLSEKPRLDLELPPKKPPLLERRIKTEEMEIKRHIPQSDSIMERNLFSVDGKYGDKVERPPENPYRLVGVIVGEKKMAIFRDYTGTLFTAKEKDRMMDGYTVEKIEENSVILKRGKWEKELRILSSKKQEAK